MPLATSAATATDVTPARWDLIRIGGHANIQRQVSGVAVDFDGTGNEQWCRMQLGAGLAFYNTQLQFGDIPGVSAGQWHLELYTSPNPDGTGLVSLGSHEGPPASNNTLTISTTFQTQWLYVRVAPAAGYGGLPLHGARIYMFTRAQALWGVETGTGTNPAQAEFFAGSTTAGIFGPSTIRGTTNVAIVIPAADDITAAPDISGGGSVLSADRVAQWGPGTQQPGEPSVADPANPYTAAKHTTWHRYYAPAAGDYTFTDDPKLAMTVPPLYGAYHGTVMSVYSGPDNAGYSDLTLLIGGAATIAPSGSDYTGASVTITVTDPTWLYIEHGYLADMYSADVSAFPPQRMSTSSGVTPPHADTVIGTPELVDAGTTVVLVSTTMQVSGWTTVTVAGDVVPEPGVLTPDEVAGSTDVAITETIVVVGTPDEVAARSWVSVVYTPDLAANPPIELAINLTGSVHVDPIPAGELDATNPGRATGLVVLELPTPIVVAGKPTVPTHLARLSASCTLTQGPNHIRAIAPAPVWDGSGYVNPPPVTLKPWSGRWVVDDLPDPPNGSYYWLGAPSSADGTANIGAGKRQWKAHGSTPHAPAWHSFYPYKPSVRAVDHYLPGGHVVHHPKGVHFNPQFIEHMWLDFGGPRRQPFTWVIAGMVVAYPSTHYTHYLLDAGRNPDKVGFPRLHDWQTSDDRKIKDGLDYRTLLSYSADRQMMCTRPNKHTRHTVRARAVGNLHPRMFFGVFNGARSMIGDYASGGRRRARGGIDNGKAQAHRYYVLGREQGWISQDHASHVLLFEIRFWDYALSTSELDEQYGQLSSTYRFDKYRRV